MKLFLINYYILIMNNNYMPRNQIVAPQYSSNVNIQYSNTSNYQQNTQQSKLIGILYLDSKYPLMRNLYETMNVMTPDLIEKIKIMDLKNVNPKNYPALVIKHKQLPLLIVRDASEPLIGPENIKRWLARTYSPSNQSQSKEYSDNRPVQNNSNSNSMYEGFSANMFGGNLTQYESLNPNANNYETNFELLNYDPKMNMTMEFMKKNGNSSTNDKKDDLTQRMNMLENQRKALNNNNLQNNGVVNIR